ncbi:MAG: hypothetical protein U9Q66_02740 [Patescibacteria group bacterium]|nr:hypothetical protein [Patescibacteria group bacterium]
MLTDPIKDEWEDKIKKQHYKNRKNVTDRLLAEFGELRGEKKIENFIALDAKPFSILAFHNRFFSQIRDSFVIGAYYPALTGVSALGERILNYLLLTLRDDYKGTPEYKKIYRKSSFDDWSVPISILQSWDILLPDVVENFYKVKEMRNKAIHFRPETDSNDRELALEAINCMKAIIGSQFSSWGTQPWFLAKIPGEMYIKKSWEEKPFIRKIYLPNCALVGFKHRIDSLVPQVVINDKFEYEDTQISDEEFSEFRNKNQKKG